MSTSREFDNDILEFETTASECALDVPPPADYVALAVEGYCAGASPDAELTYFGQTISLSNGVLNLPPIKIWAHDTNDTEKRIRVYHPHNVTPGAESPHVRVILSNVTIADDPYLEITVKVIAEGMAPGNSWTVAFTVLNNDIVPTPIELNYNTRELTVPLNSGQIGAFPQSQSSQLKLYPNGWKPDPNSSDIQMWITSISAENMAPL